MNTRRVPYKSIVQPQHIETKISDLKLQLDKLDLKMEERKL